MADRIAILQRGGVLAQYDTPDAILANPASEFVERFVGADRGLKRLSLGRVRDLELEQPIIVRLGEPGARGPGRAWRTAGTATRWWSTTPIGRWAGSTATTSGRRRSRSPTRWRSPARRPCSRSPPCATRCRPCCSSASSWAWSSTSGSEVLGAISVDAICDALRRRSRWSRGAGDGRPSAARRHRPCETTSRSSASTGSSTTPTSSPGDRRAAGHDGHRHRGGLLISFALALLIRRYPRLYGPVLGVDGTPLLHPQPGAVRAPDPDHRAVAADRRDRAGQLHAADPGAEHRRRPATASRRRCWRPPTAWATAVAAPMAGGAADRRAGHRGRPPDRHGHHHGPGHRDRAHRQGGLGYLIITLGIRRASRPRRWSA